MQHFGTYHDCYALNRNGKLYMHSLLVDSFGWHKFSVWYKSILAFCGRPLHLHKCKEKFTQSPFVRPWWRMCVLHSRFQHECSSRDTNRHIDWSNRYESVTTSSFVHAPSYLFFYCTYSLLIFEKLVAGLAILDLFTYWYYSVGLERHYLLRAKISRHSNSPIRVKLNTNF